MYFVFPSFLEINFLDHPIRMLIYFSSFMKFDLSFVYLSHMNYCSMLFKLKVWIPLWALNWWACTASNIIRLHFPVFHFKFNYDVTFKPTSIFFILGRYEANLCKWIWNYGKRNHQVPDWNRFRWSGWNNSQYTFWTRWIFWIYQLVLQVSSSIIVIRKPPWNPCPDVYFQSWSGICANKN